ncbi:PBP1A family penicillin-binding protein [Guptibacillus hwajinpoensis]|uniref:Penicillin-binding protein 1A n=1 Tax=Guptibacillus hwajinpoensis TaxID=208199 RepID=A0ABU0K2E8_9BACL|nr:PBP1A family penicillin-binding protein [Alkalihalobacillus hemicentroti]MDQ0483528.1 penicillin-binding protein 1A [Alkalihalobacillus hemicentroti]
MGKKINDNSNEERQGKRKNKKHFARNVLLFAAFLMVFVLSFGSYQTYAYIDDAPTLDANKLSLPQSSTIYDAEGNKIQDIVGKEHRKVVAFDEIPTEVINAFIAVEDVRFFDHNGVDIKRIGGAVVANVKDGFGAEGASTITQQVVKNMLLEPEKTMKRKVQEAYLAVQLEKKYSKQEILSMYLNKIYFGQGAYGVATAADVYFNKSLDELTTGEAALLAGLPQRPSGYDPYKHPELANDRRATVLGLMKQHGFISEKEREKEASISVQEMIVDQKKQPTTNDAFIDQVITDLEKAGISEEALYSGGLEVYTTLDQNAQEIVDKALTTNRAVTYPDEKFRAGISLLDTQTGAIRAIGGNRQTGENDVQKAFNYATQLERSPGSTIKPILDYAPGIEKHKWSTNKQFVDEKLKLNGKEFSNWNDEFQGSVSIREALKWSYNIPAIKAFMEVGGEEAQAFAKELGISIDQTYPAYAIGGFAKGISPLQLSGAYAAFGSGGTFHEPYSVEKVVYPNGKELALTSESNRVMNEGTAYMITDMLRTVVQEGTGMQAGVNGLDIAGKTGTTNLPEGINGDGTSDAWFSGYTTNYTAAVWTGYDQTTQESYIRKKDDDIAKLLFQHVMSEVSEGKETKSFEKPESVVELKIDKNTGLRANGQTSSSDIIKELYFKGEEPKKAVIPEPKKPEPVKKDNRNDSNNSEADKKPTSDQPSNEQESDKKDSAKEDNNVDQIEENANNNEPKKESEEEKKEEPSESNKEQEPVKEEPVEEEPDDAEPVEEEPQTTDDPAQEQESDQGTEEDNSSNSDNDSTGNSDNNGGTSEGNADNSGGSGENEEESNTGSSNGNSSNTGGNETGETNEDNASDEDNGNNASDESNTSEESNSDSGTASGNNNQNSSGNTNNNGSNENNETQGSNAESDENQDTSEEINKESNDSSTSNVKKSGNNDDSSQGEGETTQKQKINDNE